MVLSSLSINCRRCDYLRRLGQFVKVLVTLCVLSAILPASAKDRSPLFAYNEFKYQVFVGLDRKVYCRDRSDSFVPEISKETSSVCKKALPYLEALCEKGELEACDNMASLYMYEGGFSIDLEFAKTIYREICYKGYISACAKINRDLTRNEKVAIFEAVAKKCDEQKVGACFNLAEALLYGYNGRENVQKGIDTLILFCTKDDLRACYRVGMTYNPRSKVGYDFAFNYLASECRPDIYEPCRSGLTRLLINGKVKSKLEVKAEAITWGLDTGLAPVARLLAFNFDLAIEEFEDARSDQLRSSALWRTFTNALYRGVDLEAALDKFVEAKPNSAVPLLYRASYWLGKSNGRDGFQYWEKAKLPNHSKKEALKRAKKRSNIAMHKAKADLEKAIKFDKKSVYPPLLLAQIARYNDDMNRYEKMIKRARSIEPYHIDWWRFTFERTALEKIFSTKKHSLSTDREVLFEEASSENRLIKEMTYTKFNAPMRGLYANSKAPSFNVKNDQWYEREFRDIVSIGDWDDACNLNQIHLKFFAHSQTGRRNKDLCLESARLYKSSVEPINTAIEGSKSWIDDILIPERLSKAKFKVVTCGPKKVNQHQDYFDKLIMADLFDKFRKRSNCVRDHSHYEEVPEFYNWQLRKLLRDVGVDSVISKVFSPNILDFTAEDMNVVYGYSADMERIGMNLQANLDTQAKSVVNVTLVWPTPNDHKVISLESSFVAPLEALSEVFEIVLRQRLEETSKSNRGKLQVAQLDYLDGLIELRRAEKVKLDSRFRDWNAYISRRIIKETEQEEISILVSHKNVTKITKARVKVAQDALEQMKVSSNKPDKRQNETIEESRRKLTNQKFQREMQRKIQDIRIKKILEKARK